MAVYEDSLRAGGLIKGPLEVEPRTSSEVPFDIQGVTGQTAVLLRVRNVAGTTVFSVDNSGNLVIGGTTTITIDQVVTGNLNLTGNLSVTGTSTLTGAVSLATTLAVTGASTFTGQTTHQNIVVNNQATFNGGVTFNSGINLPSTFTTGSILFVGATKQLEQDNANLFWDDTNNFFAVGTTSPSARVHVVQAVATSGSPTALLVAGGAHTTLTASTEAIDVNFNLARTVQFATGALTTQRAVAVQAPTYAFVGSSTITNATTFEVTASPTAGTNCILTNSTAILAGGTVTLGATSAGMTYSAYKSPAYTATVTGSTQVTSAAGMAQMSLGILTVTDSSAVTIDNAATLYISGAVAQAGSVTITNKYSLFVDAGTSRFDGTVGVATTTPSAPLHITSASNSYRGFGNVSQIITGANCTIALETTSSGSGIVFGNVSGAFQVFNGSADTFTKKFEVTVNGDIVLTPAARATGSPNLVLLTAPAHTSLTASVESIDVHWNLGRTVTFGTGALTTQRAAVYTAPTYAFVAASTLTTASTFVVTANPAAGTNATITNSWAAQFGGTVTSGPTSASMKYAAINTPAHTATVTGSTQVTQAGSFSQVRLDQLTITDASAVTIDASATLYIAGPNIAAGSVTLTETYALWCDTGRARFDGTVLQSQGADIASANNLVLGGDGNSFEITDATQINLISNIGYQNGAMVTLLFTSTPTVKHNQATSTTNITIQLAGAADFVASAGDTLTLILSEIGGTQAWREVARAVI